MGDLASLAGARLLHTARILRRYVYTELVRDARYGPNIKRLKNWTPPTWRYRVGAWSFFYQIDEAEKTVYMIAADHRAQPPDSDPL